MADIDKLRDILARLEKAEGPDRALDAAMEVACFNLNLARSEGVYAALPHPRYDSNEPGIAEGHYWRNSCSGKSLWAADPLTASIDAALALVARILPGWGAQVGHPLQAPNAWYASVFREPHPQEHRPLAGHFSESNGPPFQYRPTGSLAILTALFRALVAQAEEIVDG